MEETESARRRRPRPADPKPRAERRPLSGSLPAAWHSSWLGTPIVWDAQRRRELYERAHDSASPTERAIVRVTRRAALTLTGWALRAASRVALGGRLPAAGGGSPLARAKRGETS